MEIFVFVRMGGTREEMSVKLLGEAAKLETRLTRFDAGKAHCFLDDDRQRLWAVIEASFGTFEPFNALVKGIFVAEIRETTYREATKQARASDSTTFPCAATVSSVSSV